VKIIDWLCAILVFALGIVHSALTPVIYRPLSLSALWFFAAGLAMVFGGMLNVLRLQGPGSPLLHFGQRCGTVGRCAVSSWLLKSGIP
jgi:hypothetical protein